MLQPWIDYLHGRTSRITEAADFLGRVSLMQKKKCLILQERGGTISKRKSPCTNSHKPLQEVSTAAWKSPHSFDFPKTHAHARFCGGISRSFGENNKITTRLHREEHAQILESRKGLYSVANVGPHSRHSSLSLADASSAPSIKESCSRFIRIIHWVLQPRHPLRILASAPSIKKSCIRTIYWEALQSHNAEKSWKM